MASKIRAIIKNKKFQKAIDGIIISMFLVFYLMIGFVAAVALDLVNYDMIDQNTQNLIFGSFFSALFLSMTFIVFTCFILGLGDRK